MDGMNGIDEMDNLMPRALTAKGSSLIKSVEMETASSSSSKAWLSFGVSTVGMVIFASLYFLSPNRRSYERSAEVEKSIQATAGISEDYIRAMNLLKTVTNATYVTMEQVMFEMKD